MAGIVTTIDECVGFILHRDGLEFLVLIIYLFNKKVTKLLYYWTFMNV